MKLAWKHAPRLLALASLGAALWFRANTGQAQPKPLLSPSCVQHHGEARYRNLGYDHVVILRNDCETVRSARFRPM
jgi:hypothetical protein